MMISFDYWRVRKRGSGLCLLVLVIVFGWCGVANAATTVSSLAVKPRQVVLLLHGMSSTAAKWNKLVNNNAGFDGRCTNTRDPKFSTLSIKPNSEGVYCMRFNFGAYDRISTAPKGLDKKICSEAGGCAGDYSTFDSLGKEIEVAVSRIRTRLGTNVQIVLLGHSRGGLAARAFLESTSALRTNVVGLMTTGTPHAGSPLGRYYTYMNINCLPESDYDGLFDTGDCADDWRFINSYPIKDLGGLDLKAPAVAFLSDASPSIIALNNKIAAIPPIIRFTQLTYTNIKFGCLGGDPIDPETGCGYDIFGNIIQFKPSRKSLNYVLNGRARNTLTGDGIVPVTSQKMTSLKGWNRSVTSYARANRIHTTEAEQILDLSTALKNMYKRLVLLC